MARQKPITIARVPDFSAVTRMFHIAYARGPSQAELQASQVLRNGVTPQQSVQDLATAIAASAEFCVGR